MKTLANKINKFIFTYTLRIKITSPEFDTVQMEIKNKFFKSSI